KASQTEAMDRILANHSLYCTVCDNNNGNCKLHNTVEMMQVEHQKYPYTPKVSADEVDMSHPFYRYDPNQCIACGHCVDVCQSMQVNETLSIDWEADRSEEHTSELQSRFDLVCRLLLELQNIHRSALYRA